MEHLLREENLSLPDWLEVLLPEKQKLFKPLQDVFRTDLNPDSTAVLAAEAISRLASDKADAQVLCEMLAEAMKDQYRPLFDALEMSGNREEIAQIAVTTINPIVDAEPPDALAVPGMGHARTNAGAGRYDASGTQGHRRLVRRSRRRTGCTSDIHRV